MRILILGHHSDTGFGVVTREIGVRLLRLGVDVRIIAVNHRGEPVRGPLEGRVWPAAIFGEPYGGNVCAAAIDGSFWRAFDVHDDWQPEAVLVVADMSGLGGGRDDPGLPRMTKPLHLQGLRGFSPDRCAQHARSCNTVAWGPTSRLPHRVTP